MILLCPICGAAVDAAEDKISHGSTIECPECNGSFTSAAKAASPMAVAAISSNRATQPSYDKGALVHRPVFHADGGTLFGIKLVNLLLGLITLGIYSFWGKVKVRKYIYSQAELLGDRFSYNGTGKELFIGALKALAILIVVFAGIELLQQLNPAFAILKLLALIALTPLAMAASRRYRLSRSTWHGIQFSFRGPVKDAILLFFKGLFLTIVTLGFYAPFFHVKMQGFWRNNTYYGSVPFGYDGNGADLLRTYIIAILLVPFTFGLSLIWLKAAKVRYDWEHTSFQDTHFYSSVTGANLFGLLYVNILMLLLSMGIASSWVIVRTINFNFKHLSIKGAVELDAIRQEAQPADAMGEGLMDHLDIDLGLF